MNPPETIPNLKTTLLPHQERLKNKLQNQRGIVAAWSPGTGKSLGALAAADAINKPTTFIAPAALRQNLPKEQAKHFNTPQNISTDTIENITRKRDGHKNPLLIVDEAHRLRDPSSKGLQAIKELNQSAEKTLLLTGTPMVNHPSDISSLINLAANEKILPENRADFERKYVYNKTVKPSFFNRLKGIEAGEVPVLNRNEKENLQNIFKKWVDYKGPSKEGFPEVEEQQIEVPMTDTQTALYDTVLGKAPPWIAAKIKDNLPLSKRESVSLNSYLSGVRQISNTTQGFIDKGKAESPKIQRAFEELKKILDQDPLNKGVVYSSYLGSGLNPYKDLLDQAKIPYGEFSGSIDKVTRDQNVKDYNEGKLRTLLLSGAGGEGLDLQNSTVLQLLESAWNNPRLEQAQARAIRYGSHASLPEEKRKVLVQKFLATRPQGLLNKLHITKPLGAVDQYLSTLSAQKSKLNQQFLDLMHDEETQEKIAKISDDVEKFLNNRDYGLLIKKLPSQKFQTSLAAKIDDPLLKSFISNNGKHAIALKRNKGTHHQIKSSSQPAKSYTVIDHGNSWTCDCQDYLYKKAPKSGECKHIIQAKGLDKTAKVIAHISGPAGAGKSTILNKLPKEYTGKDLDDFSDEAVLRGVREAGPDWYKFNAGILGHTQKLLDEYIEQNKDKSLIFAGIHSEDGKTLNIPTENKWRLSTGPALSAWRNYRRSQRIGGDDTIKAMKIPSLYLENRKDIKELDQLGYISKSEKAIISHLKSMMENTKSASAYVSHFSQETQTTCSSACAKMVLDYYGIYKTEEECSKLIGVHSKGAENNQISEMLTKLGLKCINKELTPEEVKQFLDMNCPIIIDGKSFRYLDKFHYTVLSDLDLEKDVAVIFDPNYDKKIRTLTLKELDEIWHSKQMYKPHKPLVRQGIVVIGHEKTAEESTFQKYKPYIAGAGGLLAGAAAYKGLRRFNPSANKGLATLQNAMKDKKLAIQVDKASKLHTPIFGAKTVDRTTKDLGKDYGVLNHSTSTRAIPSGGPAINTDLANALDNKVTFDKIMNQGVGFGPSQVANPTAKNTDYLHGALKDVGGDINRLKAKYPEFIMKPATGSLGQVENLVTSTDHPMFQKALKDEGMARNMLIQEKLPIDKEFRVHTLNGVPFSSMNRRIENSTLRKAWEKLTGSSGGGAFIPTIGKERQALNQFVSDAHKHIQPAFEQGHNLHSAYDVAKLKDGTYRMIESNPTPGTLMNPIINRKLQRMATGRWGKDVATLGALSAGAATSAGIANLE